jgi:hypothetical protein
MKEKSPLDKAFESFKESSDVIEAKKFAMARLEQEFQSS